MLYTGGFKYREVLKTKAGKLPCRGILHVATPHSQDKLADVVSKVLRFADQNHFKSLAFPALGTGNDKKFCFYKLSYYN